MLLQTEHGRSLVAAVISPDAFEHGVAVVKGVGQDVHLSLIPGNQFAVKPYKFSLLHRKSFASKLLKKI